MKFLDTNIWIYAYLKPKRELSKREKEIKRKVKNIIRKLEEKEEVVSSVVHLSEAANILENNYPLEKAKEIIDSIILSENIKLSSVNRGIYLLASDLAEDQNININDAVALVIMQKRKIEEIYSFDTHFDQIKWVKRKEE